MTSLTRTRRSRPPVATILVATLCLLLPIGGGTIQSARAAVPATPSVLWTIDDNFQIEYRVEDEKILFTFTLQNSDDGFMALAFHEFMFPADTIVAWIDKQSNTPICWDAYNPGIPTLSTFPSPLQDPDPVLRIPNGDPYDNQDNVTVESSSVENGTTTITCSRPMVTEDIFDFQIYPDQQFNVLAMYNARDTYTNSYLAQQPWPTAKGATRMIIPSTQD